MTMIERRKDEHETGNMWGVLYFTPNIGHPRKQIPYGRNETGCTVKAGRKPNRKLARAKFINKNFYGIQFSSSERFFNFHVDKKYISYDILCQTK